MVYFAYCNPTIGRYSNRYSLGLAIRAIVFHDQRAAVFLTVNAQRFPADEKKEKKS